MGFWTRRLIYIAFAIALSIPLIFKWQVEPDVGTEARMFYDAVERVPPEKIVVINCQFEAGTIAENGPQTRAIVAHLMKKGTRFAFIGLDPVGPGLCQEMGDELAKKFNRPYGEYWANWGYKIASAQVLKGIARDIPRGIEKDMKGTPFAQIPAMRGVRTAQDIGLMIDVDPTATYGAWIAYFTQPNGVPFAVAPTSVMISDIYPYMNSGQVVGMLKGIAGAAQYERMIEEPGQGYTGRMPVFMAHMMIILLIVIGNIIQFRERREREATPS